ncbi:hypothetical protein N0V88_004333 [Collariella sp. IMI 366227]|nr:hypothetical protein N0V88_004333 [Collariella sp. IMI 366227]
MPSSTDDTDDTDHDSPTPKRQKSVEFSFAREENGVEAQDERDMTQSTLGRIRIVWVKKKKE